MIERYMLAAALTVVSALPASAQDRDRARDRDRDDEYTFRIDTVLQLNRSGTVEIELQSGEIIVTGSSRNEVRVRGASERGQIRVDASPSHIEIGMRPPHGRRYEARVEVSVPEGTRLTVSGHSADVSIRGVRGEVDVATMNGDVVIEDASTRVEFESVSGDIRLARIQGDLRGEAVSGDVELIDATGEIDLETVSGDVMLQNVRSRSVRVETMNGEVQFEGPTQSGGRYDFSSHSGDLKLVLPEALGATIAVETFSGSIDSDFPITIQPGQHQGKEFEFRVGDGSARIAASSFSGGIYIQRGIARERE
ncbi:MAG: DUF4097 domain-containing protein [Gemmatimonadota bacterium]|nr:DUF4097 domain-containing protein [Gemmatimonadota bacterium]